MIEQILNGAFLGIKGKFWGAIILVVAAIAFVVIRIADNAVEDTLDTAKDAGRSEAIVEGHETTLDQAGDANEAGNKVRDDRGNARFDECLRSATEGTRGFCERYRRD